MNLSRFFIDRPIFAGGAVGAHLPWRGLIALRALPISEYPEVAPPSVVVRATYPGANPKVIAETVATPLEESINGVEGMLYMGSQATTDGVMTLTVTFALGTDPDKAQQLVQNRVSQAEPRLPEEVRRLGVTTVKSAPDLTMVVHMVSPNGRYDIDYLRNYAVLNVKDRLARIPGVGQVQIFGGGDYSMRAWLDPQKVAQRGLSAGDVVAAIRGQNVQAAAGVVGQSPGLPGVDMQLSINARGRLATVEEFGDIIVKTGADGAVTRLRDVARLELGAADYSLRSLLNNDPAVGMGVFQAPGSNALDISANVRATMAELQKHMPEGVEFRIAYDPTQFVRASIQSVIQTLLEAIALVVIVVILFLQTWRASIIPLLAVPVSVVGTFAVLHLLGFSINALSLFGLVLAIGIVVDDAIVVVENVERNIEAGLTPREATYRAMREVSRPIIAIALVLVAVFVPLAFISGLTGQFYRQFAVTIAISTVISAINSLTLSPALSALLLKGHHEPKDALTRGMDRVLGGFFRRFNRVFHRGSEAYSGGVRRVIGRKALMLAIYLVLVGATWGLFKAVPGGFVPAQDKQYLVGFAQLPDGATLDRTEDVIRRMGKIVKKNPNVEDAIAFPGLSINGFTNSSNAGIVFVTLKPFAERRRADQSGGAVAGQLNQAFGSIQDAFIAMFPPPPVAGAGHDGRLQAADRGPSLPGLWRHGRGREGLHGQGLPDAGAGGAVHQLAGQRAAAVRRHRPHQGPPARRSGDRHLRDPADLPGQPVRQRLQPVRPHLQRARAGRCALPGAGGGRGPAQGALHHRRDGAAVGADEDREQLRPRARHALQRFPLGRRERRARARLLVGPGAGRRRAHRRRDAAAGHLLRVDRTHLPGDPGRQFRRAGVPAGHFAGVPGAGRAVREPDAAHRHHP